MINNQYWAAGNEGRGRLIVVARLLIETGIEVGRADARRCIGLARFLSAHDVAAVSRRHLQIFVEGDRVEGEDLGSKNGTRIEPRVQGRLPTDLAPGARVAWKLRDAVSLPGSEIASTLG